MSSNRRPRGFSLIEVMIAGALLGLVGAGVFTAISYATRASAQTRARTYASSDAQTIIDRIMIITSIAKAAGATDATLCSLMKTSGGPMNIASGGTLSVNSCPALTVTNVPLANSSLKRKVSIVSEALGAKAGLRITVQVSGGQLASPGFIQVESHVQK